MTSKYTGIRFAKWVLSIVGKPIDSDGVFGNQCVDIPKHYTTHVLYPSLTARAVGIFGNGKDIYANAKKTYFQKIPYKKGLIAHRGDIVSYRATSTNKYGHTAVVTSPRWANGSSYTVVEQNGFNPSGVAYKAKRNYNNLIGFVRHK